MKVRYTVLSGASRISYVGNGSTQVFPIPFVFFDDTDIQVTLVNNSTAAETPQVLTSQYTVSGGDGSTGSVTMLTAPASGYTLVIEREMPFTQEIDYQQNDGFPAEVNEEGLDRGVMLAQQASRRGYQAPKLPATYDPVNDDPITIPLPENNKILRGKSDASGWENVAISDLALASIPTSVSSPQTGQVLRYSAGSWSNYTLNNIKNFIDDFSGVGDDSTNNDTAFTAARSYCNTTGGYVYFPQGIYRFNTAITALTRGGFLGAGCGMAHHTQNTGPLGAPHGTVFRFTGTTGNSVSIATTGVGVSIRDIGFWPVNYKTSGYEIYDQGTGTILENIITAYGYAGIYFGGNSNTCVIRNYEAFCMMVGSGGIIKIAGSSDTIANWSQGHTIDNYRNYTPWPIADPVAAKTTASWATSTAYSQGAVTTANGYVWQATTAGTSAGTGSGPTLGAIATAGGITDVANRVTDGTVVWQATQRTSNASIDIDGAAVAINILNAQILGTWYGVWCRDSSTRTIDTQHVTITHSLIDHTVSDCVRIDAGYQIYLVATRLHYSASGRGITAGASFSGGLHVQGGCHIWNNALDGIELSTATVWAVIVGNTIAGNGVLTANTYDGINVAASVAKFIVNGNILGPDTSSSGTQKYGLDIGAGCDNFVVVNNMTVGNGTGGINNGSGTAATRVVNLNV